MILRKPYAFLIKYFQRINLILLVLVGFIFYKTFKLHQFTRNYVNTTVYNNVVDSISKYTNIYTYLAFFAVIAICLVLIYLLNMKKKPISSYVFIVGVNILVLIYYLYVGNYFTYKAVNGFNLITARVINDLSLIVTLPYYILIFLLLIRSIGIDLKNFGFQEDKEFIEISESDREEVEVEVAFDKGKWIRKIKYYLRNIKYFIVEHKIIISIVSIIVLGIGIKSFYNYFYIENRIYSMKQTITSNSYNLMVANTYLTDKDFSGNIVSHDGMYFIIVDLKINNLLNYDRNFDIEKFILYIDDDYYVPSTKYNSYFKDMGNLYIGKDIKANEKTSYLLIYEVPKPSDKANFILKYQDINYKNSKLVKIKIKVLDISTFKNKGEANYPSLFTLPINEEDNISFKIESFSFSNSINYRYQACNSNGTCPIYQGNYKAKANYIVLYMKFDTDKDQQEFLDFLNSYGKIKYKINEEEKIVPVNFAVTRTYKGNHVYLVVPSEIVNADDIDILITIRTYQYYYHLKGE